jgi:hypothetical protein
MTQSLGALSGAWESATEQSITVETQAIPNLARRSAVVVFSP